MATKKHHSVPLLLLAVFLLLHASPSTACSYCPTPKPSPPPPAGPCPPPPYTPSGKCPVDTLKLAACVDVLGGLVHAAAGGHGHASQECCPLLSGVADLDAALCLCTTIKAKALDVKVVLPIAVEVLVNDCGKHVSSDFQCS